MDGDNSLNLRYWGYYEPPESLRGLNLQLMPEKPLIDTRNAAVMAAAAAAGPFNYHHRDFRTPVSQSMFQMDYNMRSDPFNSHRMFTGNLNYSMMPETSTAQQHMQMVPPPVLTKDERVDQVEDQVVTDNGNVNGNVSGNGNGNGNGPTRKRQGLKGPKSPKPKKPKKGPIAPKAENSASVPRARAVKKTAEVMINGINMDISSIPIPVCSCTGAPQQCYRWGSGGWQSACCTTGLSIYPLPMSTKRRGARIAGRKMSLGAFKKVLEKLAAEGYNFANPIDLRMHWAKHGTNKFVTIR